MLPCLASISLHLWCKKCTQTKLKCWRNLIYVLFTVSLTLEKQKTNMLYVWWLTRLQKCSLTVADDTLMQVQLSETLDSHTAFICTATFILRLSLLLYPLLQFSQVSLCICSPLSRECEWKDDEISDTSDLIMFIAGHQEAVMGHWALSCRGEGTDKRNGKSKSSSSDWPYLDIHVSIWKHINAKNNWSIN